MNGTVDTPPAKVECEVEHPDQILTVDSHHDGHQRQDTRSIPWQDAKETTAEILNIFRSLRLPDQFTFTLMRGKKSIACHVLDKSGIEIVVSEAVCSII